MRCAANYCSMHLTKCGHDDLQDLHRIFTNQLGSCELVSGGTFGTKQRGLENIEEEVICNYCNTNCKGRCLIAKVQNDKTDQIQIKEILNMIRFTVTKVAPIKKTVDLIYQVQGLKLKIKEKEQNKYMINCVICEDKISVQDKSQSNQCEVCKENMICNACMKECSQCKQKSCKICTKTCSQCQYQTLCQSC